MAITTSSLAQPRIEDTSGFYCKGANALNDDGHVSKLLQVTPEDEEREKNWFENLQTFAAGQEVLEHMALKMALITAYSLPNGHVECPVDQSHDFRNMFVGPHHQRAAAWPARGAAVVRRRRQHQRQAAAVLLGGAGNDPLFAQSPQPTRDRVAGVKAVIAHARRRA